MENNKTVQGILVFEAIRTLNVEREVWDDHIKSKYDFLIGALMNKKFIRVPREDEFHGLEQFYTGEEIYETMSIFINEEKRLVKLREAVAEKISSNNAILTVFDEEIEKIRKNLAEKYEFKEVR